MPASIADSSKSFVSRRAAPLIIYSLTKCDGYGDRACAACMVINRPVCVYRPWTTDDMRNYAIDIGEYPETSRPSDNSRAFRPTKAMLDLGLSNRDNVVIQSMLEAGPADAGTAEYREAIMRGSRQEKASASNKSKSKRKRKEASVIASEPSASSEAIYEYKVDVEIPLGEHVDTAQSSKSKRKRGWLPSQDGGDSAWADQPVAEPSSVAQPSRKSARSSKRNGKAAQPSDRKDSYAEAEYRVASQRQVAKKQRPVGRSGTDTDAGLSRRQADQPVKTAKKRQRIVSSTPEFDTLPDDALYAETNYLESFERSKEWMPFEDVLGIIDDESDDDEDGGYPYEFEQDGQPKSINLRWTAGLECEIELLSGIGWDDLEAPSGEGRGLQLVKAIARAVVAANPGLYDVSNRASPVANELAHGLGDADADDTFVENLLP